MKNIICFAIIIVIGVYAFGQETPVKPDETVPKNVFIDPPLINSAKGPFEDDLNRYYFWRNVGGAEMLWGGVGVTVGFLADSTFLTASSLNGIDSGTAQIGEISSAVMIGLAAIVAFHGFVGWINNSNDYMDTLRLQQRYYNLFEQ